MIILTAAQAAQVAGETTPGHSLSPVALTNGAYVLEECVLTDLAHQQKWALLSSLPTRIVAQSEYPQPVIP